MFCTLHDTLNSPLIPQARPPPLLLTCLRRQKSILCCWQPCFCSIQVRNIQLVMLPGQRALIGCCSSMSHLCSFHTTVFEVINIKHVWNMIMSVHPSHYRIIWTDSVFSTVLYSQALHCMNFGLYSSTWMHHIRSAHFKCFQKQSYLVWVGHPKTFDAYFWSPGHTRHGNNDPMWPYELQSHMASPVIQ